MFFNKEDKHLTSLVMKEKKYSIKSFPSIVLSTKIRQNNS